MSINGVLRSCLVLVALAGPAAPAVKPIVASKDVESSTPEIRVGPDGAVYWVDSFGRIQRDGASTGWRPQAGAFEIDPAGNAVYVDSFGRMCKSGHAYSGWSEHGAHGSASDGSLFWISQWNQELMRDEDRTGYRATWQSAIRVDGFDNVYYVNPETRTLWRNGDDLHERLLGVDFLVNGAGKVYYRSWVNQTTSQIWCLDPASLHRTFVDWAHNPPFLKLDALGRPWYVGQYGQLKCDRQPMFGLTGFGAFKLGRAGRVYTRRHADVLRDGVVTGYRAPGSWDVSPDGDVFAITDPTWGRIEKNGFPLPFSVR